MSSLHETKEQTAKERRKRGLERVRTWLSSLPDEERCMLASLEDADFETVAPHPEENWAMMLSFMLMPTAGATFLTKYSSRQDEHTAKHQCMSDH